MECVKCVCVWLGGGVGGIGGEWVTGLGLGFTNSVGYVFWLWWCEWCWGRVGGRLGSGMVGCCYVCILCVDGRSRYLYIVLGGFLRILGAHSVQSWCTLSISAS